MKLSFWGTRGSIPSPLDTQEFRIKAKRLLMNAQKVNLASETAIEHYLSAIPLPNVPPLDIDNHKLLILCNSMTQLGYAFWRTLNQGSPAALSAPYITMASETSPKMTEVTAKTTRISPRALTCFFTLLYLCEIPAVRKREPQEAFLIL